MIAKKPTFQTAQDFLSERLRLDGIVKRVGVVVHANFGELNDKLRVGERLNAIFDLALEKVELSIDEKFGAIADTTQKVALQFFYAQSRKIPEEEQVAMLHSIPNSTTVSLAAASQKKVPEALQFALLEQYADHPATMRALIAKNDLHPMILGVLASHEDSGVRFDVARHIGNRMKISENMTEHKEKAYNAIVDRFEADFADYLVPVCRNAEQIQQMFDETPMVPSKIQLFVNNPYTPDKVLLDIISSTVTRVMPGGAAAIEDARKVLDNRLNNNISENTSTPDI